MGKKIDLSWNQAILVSIYSDLPHIKLPNLLLFRSKSIALLSALEYERGSSYADRTVKYIESEINTNDVVDVRGAAHSDITNMRFLLQDNPKDLAITQLIDLKAHALSCVEKSPTPKRAIFKIKRTETPVSPSPLPRTNTEVERRPDPHIRQKPESGNELSVRRRIKKFKRELSTEDLVSQSLGPVRIPFSPTGSEDPSDVQQVTMKLVLDPLKPKKQKMGDTASNRSIFPAFSIPKRSPFSTPASKNSKFSKLVLNNKRSPLTGSMPMNHPQSMTGSPKIKVITSGKKNKRQQVERKIASLKKKKRRTDTVPQAVSSDMLKEQKNLGMMDGKNDESADKMVLCMD